jgi:enamine deaminase RidA (YjgF/YER057c/UK114 family)
MEVIPHRYYKVIDADVNDSFSKGMERIVKKLIEILKSDKSTLFITRMTFFLDIESAEELSKYSKEGSEFVERMFGNAIPPYSFVSQAPEGAGLMTCEAAFFSNSKGDYSFDYKKSGDTPYLVLSSPSKDEVIVSGVTSDTKKNFEAQSVDVFTQMENILHQENMVFSDIIRQWSYIGDITGMYGEKQNYQVFNNVRANFYAKSDNWIGFPAATGIGMRTNGIVVDFVAARLKGVASRHPLKNPAQTDAHEYSQDVLVGQKNDEAVNGLETPRFERAMAIWNSRMNRVIISGTAAITGENTVATGNVEDQTNVTLNNIETLVSPENIKNTIKDSNFIAGKISVMRGYVKHKKDVTVVRDIIKKRYPDTPLLMVEADICRDDLLVEIEGEYWFTS